MNLERIQQEYDRIQAILAWDTVTEDDLLSMEFPEDANFVQFTRRIGNRFVRGRLTRDRGGNVSINIDHTMLPCELHEELRVLQLNAGRIFLSAGEQLTK